MINIGLNRETFERMKDMYCKTTCKTLSGRTCIKRVEQRNKHLDKLENYFFENAFLT